ncbi:MAG: type II toxin-antitoxin system VapC family toxin [Anaerolineae bacterium]|nr:type II toxin-antitoxin system VapC family toxin [Anaerolineae bacterium]
MILLLDTHTFIWWDSDPAKLSPQVLALCQDRDNTVLLSVVSVWEMQIKSQLGRLTLHRSLTEIVTSQQQANGIQILPVTLTHVLALDTLPLQHKDPFDRLLISQANLEGATLLSKDAIFTDYAVKVIW